MMILSGPLGPKFMADALVASENVGDGGPGDFVLLAERVSERRERAAGMTVVTGMATTTPRRAGTATRGRVETAESDAATKLRRPLPCVPTDAQQGACERLRAWTSSAARSPPRYPPPPPSSYTAHEPWPTSWTPLPQYCRRTALWTMRTRRSPR